MEDFGFEIGGLISEEEAAKLFEESEPEKEPVQQEPAEPENGENEVKPAEEEEEAQPSERVGEEEIEEDAAQETGEGSSPNVYSSIAHALKGDGIFPDFEDTELDAATTPEAFSELFRKAVKAELDERQRRIDEALENGVKPDTVRSYEQNISYLDSLDDDAINAEGENGENVRKQLIWNELILVRKYSREKAAKELEKSLKSGSDVEDATDAREALKEYFQQQYDAVREEASRKADEEKARQKKQSEDFRKMVIDDELSIGDVKLDKHTKQRVFDVVAKPVCKDKDTGALMTEMQKFQKEHPLEFLKQLGMWFVLTDGGKDLSGFAKVQMKLEKNKGVRELEKKINATSINADGSLRYFSGAGGDSDPLLDDGWKIGG